MVCKRVAIVQSCYIPWKGFFDLIRSVDEFILYDDMQYTRRDWRNRNRIKTPQGLKWLTIPVSVKGKYLQKIRETRVVDPSWTKKHWSAICFNYQKAPFFPQYRDRVKAVYSSLENEVMLSQINYAFIIAICEMLNIRTRITWSMDYELVDGKTDRIVGLCKSAGATHYLSGPSAKGYIQKELFDEAGIELAFAHYSGYPEYHQLHGQFEHGVTVLDLLFNTGPDAVKFMKKLM